MDNGRLGGMERQTNAGIRRYNHGTCCVFQLYSIDVGGSGAPSIAHNGRNTAVVFFLFAPYRHRCVFTLALSVDIIFLYCVGYSVRLCEHFQAGNTQ